MTRDDLIARASAIKGDETECWISDPWVAIVPLLSLKIHAKPALFDVASQDASVVQMIALSPLWFRDVVLPSMLTSGADTDFFGGMFLSSKRSLLRAVHMDQRIQGRIGF